MKRRRRRFREPGKRSETPPRLIPPKRRRFVPTPRTINVVMGVVNGLDAPMRKEGLVFRVRKAVNESQHWDMSGETITRALRYLVAAGRVKRIVVGPRGKVAYGPIEKGPSE